ncbi:unnamed protein product [Chondrus crispus]|uniref:Uncharacterized protein n=1 Tax=Chondrus crispus TaxID=2769 RepID=R7QED7_CHOCR|nr:unnamed protein product [Chondrus crispus]CDF36877.1 unnamed protein product [Chondrus crispus]|eukprot:XP_005716696.1 unnamed protein product [Chondrus crispus]
MRCFMCIVSSVNKYYIRL